VKIKLHTEAQRHGFLVRKKKGPYRNTVPSSIACHIKRFYEVMDGVEPPYKVLQTCASPLGHMTVSAAILSCINYSTKIVD
jgi:hypothetical protein